MIKQSINGLFSIIALTTLAILLIKLNENINHQNLEFGFDFLFSQSGFDIGDTWIAHTHYQTYAHAILIGLCNTFILAIACVLLSTLIGIFFAILSTNHSRWLKLLSSAYINLFRNIPLLVQILFFYTSILYWLPPIEETLQFADIHLSNRGLFFPKAPSIAFLPLLLIPLIFIKATSFKNRKNLFLGLIIIWGVSLFFYDWQIPTRTRFSLSGGGQLSIEWFTLLIALSIYSSSYIAECIRGGIHTIYKHQTESAKSLGLNHLQIMIKVILPQAVPIFMPALLNQYLNLTKNISLAIAIGYPDFFGITAGTILNQSGRSLECILVVICIYGLINTISTYFIENISYPKWKNHV